MSSSELVQTIHASFTAIYTLDGFLQMTERDPGALASTFSDLDQEKISSSLDTFHDYLAETADGEEQQETSDSILAAQMAASFKEEFRGKETPESDLLVSIITSIGHGIDRLWRRLDKRMPPSESKDINLNWADIDSEIQKAADKLVSVNEKAHALAGAMKFLDGEATQKILLDARKQDLDNKKIRDLEQKAMAVAEEHRQSLEKLRAEHAKEMAAQMEDKTKMLSVIVEKEENEKRLLEQLEEMETEIEQRQKEKDLLVDKVIRLRSRESRFMDKLEEKRRQIKEMKKEKRQMKESEAAVGEHLARALAILAVDEKSRALPPVREAPDLEELELEARLQLHATARELMVGREPQPIEENFPPPRY